MKNFTFNFTTEGILNMTTLDTCKCQIECLSINQYLPTIAVYLSFFLGVTLLFFIFAKDQIFPNKTEELRDYIMYLAFIFFLAVQLSVWMAVYLGGVFE